MIYSPTFQKEYSWLYKRVLVREGRRTSRWSSKSASPESSHLDRDLNPQKNEAFPFLIFNSRTLISYDYGINFRILRFMIRFIIFLTGSAASLDGALVFGVSERVLMQTNVWQIPYSSFSSRIGKSFSLETTTAYTDMNPWREASFEHWNGAIKS